MNKTMQVVMVLMMGGLTGCLEKPNWLDTTIDWYDQDSVYMGGNTILVPNQLIGIPENAAFGNIVTAFRQQNGTYVLTEMVVRVWYTNTDPPDSFQYVLDETISAEPFEAPILVRDAVGNPIYGVLHLTVDACYSVEGPYHDEIVASPQASCKLVPMETLTKAEEEEMESNTLLWGIIKAIQKSGGTPSTTSNDGGS